MLKNALTRLVDACTRYPRAVIAGFGLLAAAAAVHSLLAFSIDTDTKRLLPATLPWRQVQIAYERKFPRDSILVVVEAPTAEGVAAASQALVDGLRSPSIKAATALGSGSFFDRNTLLFAPVARARELAGSLVQSAPLIGIAARDPSLRGIASLLVADAQGVAGHRTKPAPFERLLRDLTATITAIRDGRPAQFSWQATMSDTPPGRDELRRFIGVEPVLDYRALEPGRAATDAIRQTAERLDLAGRYGASVRLTGDVPINDEQFATLQHGQVGSLLGTAAVVLVILFLALRSSRIILAVAVTLAAGFAITCSLGLLMVGSFNLLSIAFAVLFVGLGADFGIQFSVRYRSERHDVSRTGPRGPLRAALVASASKAGIPLSLACAGTTVGFFSFVPTAYLGISELGLIAGVGMIVAFATTMTLLPALLAVLAPPREPERIGFTAFAGIDHFLGRHRIAVVAATLVAVTAGSPLLLHLRFDFDPTHLQVQSAPAVRTYRDLATDPASGIAAIDLDEPSLDRARVVAARLAALPTVDTVRTVTALVPADQDAKLKLVGVARRAVLPSLDGTKLPAPTDAEDVRALREAAARLTVLLAADRDPVLVDAARRMSDALSALASGPAAVRARTADRLVEPLRADLARIRSMLGAAPVTLADLPAGLKRQWIAPDGSARVQVLPKGDPRDDAVLLAFGRSVGGVAPNATGEPMTLIGSRRTVLGAFERAAVLATVAIAAVLLIALRRVGDVLLTLLPLLVAGLLTLEICVATGQQLNFANVVALPLLLGVGVAFKIYYVMAWRRGSTDLLASTLTRAVLFSALTTGTAFGSLWLSPEPGLSSMGELMALALLCTLCAAVLFQPALMGPPRSPSPQV